MTCEHIANQLPLYFYGELTQEEEERVEQHLDRCQRCTGELGKFRSLAHALSRNEAQVSDRFLNECRTDLTRALRAERSAPALNRGASGNWMARVQEFMNLGVGFRIPAGALALVAVGFLAGKVAPGGLGSLGMLNGGGQQQAGFVSVRSVEPDGTGKVHISFDDVSRRSLDGSLNDPKVRELLLQSMHDESNAGLRVEAAGIIKDHASEAQIRSALVQAVQRDPNVGVRLVALDGLKQYGTDPEVRKALIETLSNDVNAGVRVKVIDVLTAGRDESLVGPLQSVMQKESNSYVRMRITNALRGMNASVGTF